MTFPKMLLGVVLFALAAAILYVWGLKKSLGQEADLERNLMHACGSRVVKALRRKGSITESEIASLIEGTSAGMFWSRQKARVQNGAKAAGAVIDFLLDQQYIESCGKDTYRLKK